MDNDDRPVGQILSRRDILKLFGITSAALLAGCIPGASGTTQQTGAPAQATSATATGALPACVVRPEVTEGPYYVDEDLDRSDVRSDPVTGVVKDGALLGLAIRVSQIANGQAAFTTIYPGWYASRTVHIHFKVHNDTSEQSNVFTSQLFFDDALSDQVFSQAPYASKGQRDTLNSTDGIYDDRLLLAVTPAAEGYAAIFDIGLQMA